LILFIPTSSKASLAECLSVFPNQNLPTDTKISNGNQIDDINKQIMNRPLAASTENDSLRVAQMETHQ
jgi:hypothetical protein